MWRRVGCASLGENQNTQVEKRYLEHPALGGADAHRAMGVPRWSRRKGKEREVWVIPSIEARMLVATIPRLRSGCQALGRADAHREMGVPRRSRRILSSRWRWRGRFRAGRGSRFGKWKREIESGGTKVPRLRRSRPFVHWYPALARWANF